MDVFLFQGRILSVLMLDFKQVIMMKIRNNTYSAALNRGLVLLLVPMLLACSDFLDRPPLDQLAEDSFYKTANDARLAVLSAYGPMQNVDWYGKSWMIHEIPADNAEPGGNDPEFSPIDNFTINADNVPNAQHWAQHYRMIALANQVISKVPDITMDEEARNEIVAEARFLRAFSYFDLVRIYGDVPIITEVPTIASELNVFRDPVEEVYSFIIEDLTTAYANLPSSYSASNIGRATKGAAGAILAKVYLTNKDFDKAMEIAREIIASNQYKLMESYESNWLKDVSDNNAESIFQVQYTGCGPIGTGNALQAFFAPWGQGITKASDGWGSQVPTGPSVNNPGTTIQDAFEEGDLRKHQTIMIGGSVYPEINAEDGGYTYPSTSISRTNANIKKYVIGGGSDVCFMTTPQNVHVIRYPDVLLTLAEAACAKNGGISTSADVLEAFNAVRLRAGLESVDVVTSELVLHERRIEFAFENQRWFDLLRSGSVIDVMLLHGKQMQDYHLLFPIPSEEIAINGNLTQNPGY